MTTYYFGTRKPFTPPAPESGLYYNLASGRQIKKIITADRKDYEWNEHLRIAGKPDQMKEFLTDPRNKLTGARASIAEGKAEDKGLKALTSVMQGLNLVQKGLAATASGSQAHTAMQLAPKYVARMSGPIPIPAHMGALYVQDQDRIERVSQEEKAGLRRFNFNGLHARAELAKDLDGSWALHDGDTFDIWIYVPFSFFTHERTEGKLKGPAAVLEGEGKFEGMAIRLTCRYCGLDAAEIHDQPQGTIARDLLLEEWKTRSHTMYVECSQNDKYGRTLVELYPDATFQDPIGKKLLDWRDTTGRVGGKGEVFLPYDGGEKSKFSWQLRPPAPQTYQYQCAPQPQVVVQQPAVQPTKQLEYQFVPQAAWQPVMQPQFVQQPQPQGGVVIPVLPQQFQGARLSYVPTLPAAPK